jgi:hypothetical protein
VQTLTVSPHIEKSVVVILTEKHVLDETSKKSVTAKTDHKTSSYLINLTQKLKSIININGN